jgi:hypothetical protein
LNQDFFSQWPPQTREVYEKILKILPDGEVSPFQVYGAGKKIMGKSLLPFLKFVQETPWGLTWAALVKIAERMPGPEGPGFWAAILEKRGMETSQCSLCWRYFKRMYKKQSTCPLHSSKNVKEYFRLKRLLPLFEEVFPTVLSLHRHKIEDSLRNLPGLIETYPHVYKYLKGKGVEVTGFKDDEGSLVVLKNLYSPLVSAPSHIVEMPNVELIHGDILPRAEAWLSLLDPLTGKAKGWGGRRPGSGRKSLSPSCHPESLKLIEMEGIVSK